MAKASASLLSKLTFRDVSRPVKMVMKRPRDVVLDFINQQIALATAEQEGRIFSIEKTRYTKDANGVPLKQRIAATPRRHFWQAEGEWLVEVRYGNIIVELSPGHPSVAAGSSLADVITTLNTVKAAVEAGEADEAVAVAAGKARRKAAV